MSIKHILVGVPSSVAIYKVLYLIRFWRKRGIEVKVIMTKNATKFVSPLLFKVISENEVLVDLFSGGSGIEHISLTSWADVFIVVPATANIISKIANGIADDALSTTALAVDYNSTKLFLCPAMNKRMYENPIIQENLQKLKRYGWNIIEPEEGLFASLKEGRGRGRLANLELIGYTVLREDVLKGKRAIVTAGATREYIDLVRYISNPATGKLGVEIAKQLWLKGAEVKLIVANPIVKIPKFLKDVIIVETSQQLLEALEKYIAEADILVMNSAVGDFIPEKKYHGKIKKRGTEKLNISLVPNIDILKTLGSKKRENQIFVGFSVESENYIENSMVKLREKNLDMIVLNPIEAEGEEIKLYPFGDNPITAIMLTKDGKQIPIEKAKKTKIASEIVKHIISLLR